MADIAFVIRIHGKALRDIDCKTLARILDATERLVGEKCSLVSAVDEDDTPEETNDA